MKAPPTTTTRVQQAILAVAFMGAVTACLVLGNVLAERLSPRVDITASGEHRLSPRTLSTLRNLEGKYRVVVATGFDAATRRSRQRLQDVLGQMVEAAGEDRLSTSLIDVNGPSGQDAFEKLQRDLADRERGSIQAHARAVRSACGASRESAASMEKLATDLEVVRDAIPASDGKFVATREALDAGARQARANAKGLVETAGTIEQELSQQEKATIVPNTPPMASALQQQLSSAATYLQGVADGLVNFAGNQQAPKTARDRASELVAGVRDRRSKAAMEGDALARLPKLDILRVASAIQSQSVALVIGPGGEGSPGGGAGKGMNAIPIDRLVPPDAVLSARAAGGAGGDSRRDAEELLGTALGMLSEPARPIVVFVHGEASRGLVKAAFGPLVDSLLLKGIDSEEWACVAENDPPSVAAIDPTGSRPVVFSVIGTNSARGSGAGGPSGVERSQRLGRVLGQLIAEGKPVLVSVFPSTLPAFGQTDPMAAALAGVGVELDAGRPILHEATTTAGRRVDAFARLTSARGEHPVLRAIGNLPTLFEWPIPMKAKDDGAGAAAGFVTTKLFEISDAASWGESEWMAYAQIPMESHAPGMAMAPMIDSAQDSAQGPWTIAMASEKRDLVGVAGRASTQRAIVVGSSRWFVGDVVNSSASVDGRLVRTNPGNAELFESSVLWLAGQDELIAQSVAARTVALVRPLKPGTVMLLRWALMAGLPLAALGLGAAWRFWRG